MAMVQIKIIGCNGACLRAQLREARAAMAQGADLMIAQDACVDGEDALSFMRESEGGYVRSRRGCRH